MACMATWTRNALRFLLRRCDLNQRNADKPESEIVSVNTSPLIVGLDVQTLPVSGSAVLRYAQRARRLLDIDPGAANTTSTTIDSRA
jgi:hypothetical protein